MIRTAAEFIDNKGGPTAVAKATGHSPGAVALWRHRNKLPRKAWPEIISAFPETTLTQLKDIEGGRVRKSRRRADLAVGAGQ